MAEEGGAAEPGGGQGQAQEGEDSGRGKTTKISAGSHDDWGSGGLLKPKKITSSGSRKYAPTTVN